VGAFADWLSRTPISVSIQSHEWIIPAVQSIHIVAIGIALASVFMIDLRVLGCSGRDQTLTATVDRFSPWLWGALAVLLGTGIVMIVGEPVRELMAFSFWSKMSLVAIGATVAAAVQRSIRKDARGWEAVVVHRRATKSVAILTLLIWASIVVLGRLIAYDHVWGSWSFSPKA